MAQQKVEAAAKEEDERSELFDKIGKYRSSPFFAQFCENIRMPGNSATVEELRQVHKQILGNMNADDKTRIVNASFYGILKGVESIAVQMGVYDLYGFNKDVIEPNTKLFERDLAQIAIERKIPVPGPEVRIAMTIASCMGQYMEMKKRLREEEAPSKPDSPTTAALV